MSYIGNSPQTVTRIDFIFTATDGQTVFSGADNYSKVLTFNVNEHDVYVNGRLIDKSDYTCDGSSVTFTTGRIANDLVMVRAMGVYQIADFYTKAESNSMFVSIITSTTLPIGHSGLLFYVSANTVTNGNTVNGNTLYIPVISNTGVVSSGSNQTGIWKNNSGITLSGNTISFFTRIS